MHAKQLLTEVFKNLNLLPLTIFDSLISLNALIAMLTFTTSGLPARDWHGTGQCCCVMSRGADSGKFINQSASLISINQSINQ